MPEGDFHFQLPEGEAHESSALLHGQTLVLRFFAAEFPPFLAEHSTDRSLEMEMKLSNQGCCKAIPECCDPPVQNSQSLCFPTPQLCEETTPVRACVQMKALWRETGIT